jgi:hypothetical protein
MLRRMQVSNFRSLVQSQLLFEENYTCLVGANNVGKSNVITALKWLLSPQSLSSKGLPNVDLSRTSTSRTVSICTSIDYDKGLSDIDFGFQIDHDGLVHIGRSYEFQGRDEGQNHVLFTDYAKPSPLHVLTSSKSGTPIWRELDVALALLPDLVHIRPSDIGQQNGGLSQGEQDLRQLKWPEELDDSDKKWVNDSFNEIFGQTGFPKFPEFPVVFDQASRLIAVWDEYLFPVPLRKAGTGIIQVVYSLASIALAKRRNKKLGQLARSLLICIDEPEQHLSSGAQKSYAQFLKKLSNELQVIVTTHSQHFLSKDKPGANCVLIRDQKNGTAQIKSEFATYEAIRTVLGIGIDDSLYLGNINVVVEGDCELFALRQVLRAGFEQGVHKNNPDEVFIIPRCSASKIPPFVDFVAQLGLPVLVMLDNDREALEAEKVIRGQSKGQHIDILKIPLESGREEAEIEDLIPEDILIEIVTGYLEKHRGIHLTKDDFLEADKHNEWIKKKKWNQRLNEVLKFKNALPTGIKIDDLVQKNVIIREAMDRLGVLSKDTVHSFMWDTFPQKISEMLESFKKTNMDLRYGIVMNTRGYSWAHPSNLVDHLDHDF